MKAAVFDFHSFEKELFIQNLKHFPHELTYIPTRLSIETAPVAKGFPAICCFANDKLDRAVLQFLSQHGLKFIALRSAGFNHVDLKAAKEYGVRVARVPEYSPYSVAEFAMGLILTLNRKIHKAYHRVREQNFSLDGLMGFDIHGKTIGILGTGKIGSAFTKICHGFGARCLLYDEVPNQELSALPNVDYVDLKDLYTASDIISLHVPLTPKTKHLIDEAALKMMKRSVLLINTGRGALIDTRALIQSLKQQTIGGAALDVYEEEENVFFHDLSEEVLQDDTLARLITFPNVVITSHQAFLTQEAVGNIVKTTLTNLTEFEKGIPRLATEL